MAKIAIADAAYLAGLIDGDGSIFVSCRKATNTYRLIVSVVSVNSEVLAALQEKYKKGVVFEQKQNYNLGRITWEGAAAKELLDQLLPYFIGKKEQAKLALQYPSTGRGSPGIAKSILPDIRVKQKILYGTMRQLNRRWSVGKTRVA